MKRLCIFLMLAGCGASARTHVERAVEAHGSLDVLRAITNFHVATEGNFMGMEYTTVTHGWSPHDWRHDMEGDWGKMVLWALGADGIAYASMNGRTTLQEGDRRRGLLGHARAATAALLPDRLLADNVRLRLAEPEEIGGRMCKGVDVYFGDGIERVKYFFDPETKRIARMRFTFFDDEALEWVLARMDVSDYREIEGVWVAHKSAMKWRNVSFAEQVTEVRFNRNFDESLLATPETVPPPEVSVKQEPAARVAVYKFVGPPDQTRTAIGRVMAWISSLGGQPAGPVTMVYRKPTNYADMTKNEVVIHVPVQLEKAPAGGDMWVGGIKPFQFAYVTFTGNMMGANSQYGTVYAWCEKNGYRRSGPRRMRTLKFDEATGTVTAEIGFPVKRAATGYYPGG